MFVILGLFPAKIGCKPIQTKTVGQVYVSFIRAENCVCLIHVSTVLGAEMGSYQALHAYLLNK